MKGYLSKEILRFGQKCQNFVVSKLIVSFFFLINKVNKAKTMKNKDEKFNQTQ